MGEAETGQADVVRPDPGGTAADTAAEAGAGGGRSVKTRRRRVTVDDVVGVFALRDGRWVLANDAEVRIVEALRGFGASRARLLALAATLDAGLIDGSQLRRLNRVLDEIARGTPQRLYVPAEMLTAVAYACACWSNHAAGEWLRWALSAQLDSGLVRAWLPGPGCESLHDHNRLVDGGFGRETHWICEMPESFWDRLGSHFHRTLRDVAVVCDPDTAPKVLREMAEQARGQGEFLDLVASHPRAPKHLLTQMAFDPWGPRQTSKRVAQNRNTAPRTLAHLGGLFDPQLRAVVALHPSTPRRTLKQLAEDADTAVRVAVAKNSNADGAVLALLAQDPASVVRSWVAVHASTPAESLEQLLGERHAMGRACAAANPNTPLDAVVARAGDRAIKVRAEVAARDGIDETTLGVLATDPKPAVRAAAASNVGCGVALLGRLARDDDRHVRAAAAANPSTPDGVLKTLAADDDWLPRMQVASNPATAADLLAVLADDTDEFVRVDVADNPKIAGEVLERLSGDTDTVRAAVASNPAVCAGLLRSLAADPSDEVRLGAAENPSLPADVLAALAGDSSYHVRAAAAARLPRRRGRRRNKAPAANSERSKGSDTNKGARR